MCSLSESPGRTKKTHISELQPAVSDSGGLDWSPGICTSIKYPGDAEGTDLRPTGMEVKSMA